MTRGGARPNAGRKNTWASGCRFEDTKSIRVPLAIADEVLKAAHEIDKLQSSGGDDPGPPDECLSESQLSHRLGMSESNLKSIRLAIAADLGSPDTFHQWLRQRDPQGLEWVFNEGTSLYYLGF